MNKADIITFMTEYITEHVEYIFLDVVRFTHNRSVEAQTDIISALNQIVKKSIEDNKIKETERLFFPTGDGICIALLNVNHPYDIAVKVALHILELKMAHNSITENTQRKFNVRIGISRNKDNLVIDINGNNNLAGTGINTAQRIMNFADGGQILLSESAHDELKQREPYMALFKEYQGVAKHNETITVHQLIKEAPFLNNKIPAIFAPKVIEKKEEVKLTQFAAYFMACALSFPKRHAIKISMGGSSLEIYCIMAFYFYALDYIDDKECVVPSDRYNRLPGPKGASFEQVLACIQKTDFIFCQTLVSFIQQAELAQFAFCFVKSNYVTNYFYCSEQGKAKLKKDWPDIWKEFDLDNC